MPFPKRPRPSRALWLETVARHAGLHDVPASDVVRETAKRSEKICLARWGAWRELLESGNGYSVFGVAQLTGFDHSTILSAMKRLPVLEGKLKIPPVKRPPAPPPMTREEIMRQGWAGAAKSTRVHGKI